MDDLSRGVPPARTIATTSPLTGGGSLTADRTIAIGPGSANDILGTTGGAAAWRTLSAILDSVLGNTRGMVIRRGAAAWEALAKGSAGEVLAADANDTLFRGLSALLDAVFGSTRGQILRRGSSAWEAHGPGTAGHVLTAGGAGADAAFAAAVAGNVRPSVTNWGSDTRDADTTLVAGDHVLQVFDCTAARSCALSEPDDDAHWFWILNRSAEGFSVTLKDQNGDTLGTIAPMQMARCVCDGDTGRWYVVIETVTAGAMTAGYQMLTFAGDVATTLNRRYNARGTTATSASTTTDGPSTEIKTPGAGVIDRVAFVYQTNGTQTFDLRKNGAVSESFAVTSGVATGGYFQKQFNANTSVAQGDTLSVSLNASTSTIGGAHVFVWRRSTDRGYTLEFGADPTADDVFFLPDGSASVSHDTGINTYTTEHILPVALVDAYFIWHTETASGTTQIEFRKNGAVSETFTLTGTSGVRALAGTSWAAGDQVSVEYDAGTDPGRGTYSVEFTQRGLAALTFSGDAGTNANSYLHSARSRGGATTATTETESHSIVQAYRIALHAYAFNGAASANANLTIRKNGAVDQTITVAATEQVGSLTGTTYARGDRLAVTADSASAPDLRIHIAARVVAE